MSSLVCGVNCERVCELVLSQYDVTMVTTFANSKLGQDKTRLSSHRISRLDKTVSNFSVADSLDVSRTRVGGVNYALGEYTKGN